MTTKAKNKTSNRQLELMRGFHFDSVALDANRVGHISDEQRNWIQKRQRMLGQKLWYYFYLSIGFIGFVLLTVFEIVYINFVGNLLVATLFGIFGGAFVIIWSLLVFVMNTHRRLILKDLRVGNVEAIQGLTAVNTETGQVVVNEVALNVPPKGLMYIKHLEPHVVYYLPRSKVIVSVEVIEA